MNIWQHLSKIEELTYRLDNASSVVRMTAEQLHDNDLSGALWLASDVISQQSEAISNQVSEAMAVNKELTERIDALEKEVVKVKKIKK
jgi:hypothetical protein